MQTMKKRFGFIVLCPFFIVLSTVYGQEGYFQITGQVVDSQTGLAVPFAHIYLESSGIGTVTDTEGQYHLIIPSLLDTLVISCIGYEVQKMPPGTDTGNICNVSLIPKIVALKGVTITADPLQVVFKDERYSVMDYELAEDIIYLLIYRDRLSNSELLLLSQTGDTLLVMNNLPARPKGLFKDCLDNIHLITSELAYQILYEGQKLEFLYPTELGKFNETFSNCITSLHDKLYFGKYSFYNQVITYYSSDRLTSEWKPFTRVMDPFTMNMIRRNDNDRFFLSIGDNNEAVMGDIAGEWHDRDALSSLRRVNFESRFAKLVMFTPVEAPLKRIDENIAIFDYPNSKIQFLDPFGKKIYEVPISFHQKNTSLNIFEGFFRSKGWDDYPVYVDEPRFRAYALFTRAGIYELREINLFSGEIIHSFRLAFPEPEKITVHNGFAWFLYKPQSDWTNKRLYRQRLE